MKLAAVETNDRFFGCGAECLSAELRRLFLLHERKSRFQSSRIGLDAVIHRRLHRCRLSGQIANSLRLHQ